MIYLISNCRTHILNPGKSYSVIVTALFSLEGIVAVDLFSFKLYNKEKYEGFGNNLTLKYHYNLVFTHVFGKLLYLLNCNEFVHTNFPKQENH